MTQIKNVIARDGPLLEEDWTFSIPLRRRARDADYQSTSAIRYGGVVAGASPLFVLRWNATGTKFLLDKRMKNFSFYLFVSSI
ncbi:hypothetical protein CEXT_737131 [Caerostris extrusa]|uniref:Uncharacterized protein n=1 Tax=Caerostris extrusa TaxID=172846 RepID=A0AAV4UQK6_CAEEX|nr:hypothetical protein CEXT_737131 [Caerostris extrusa]